MCAQEATSTTRTIDALLWAECVWVNGVRFHLKNTHQFTTCMWNLPLSATADLLCHPFKEMVVLAATCLPILSQQDLWTTLALEVKVSTFPRPIVRIDYITEKIITSIRSRRNKSNAGLLRNQGLLITMASEWSRHSMKIKFRMKNVPRRLRDKLKNYVPNFLESLELLFWIEVQSRLWQVLQIFFDVVHDASPNYPWLNSSKLDCTFPNVFTAVRTYCWTHRAVSMIWNEGKRRILLLAQHRLLHALKIIGIKMNGIAKNHSRDFYTSVLEKASRWWCCSSSPKWKLSRVELVNKHSRSFFLPRTPLENFHILWAIKAFT